MLIKAALKYHETNKNKNRNINSVDLADLKAIVNCEPSEQNECSKDRIQGLGGITRDIMRKTKIEPYLALKMLCSHANAHRRILNIVLVSFLKYGFLTEGDLLEDPEMNPIKFGSSGNP